MRSSVVPLSVGDPAVSEWLSDSSISIFFLLLKETPKLLARLASVLVAVIDGLATVWGNWLLEELVVRGDVLGIWYDVVLLLLLMMFAIPSDIDPSGEGVLGSPKGFPSPDDGEDTKGRSDSAVVGAALAIGEPDTTFPKAGTRPTENLEVDDIRDARDPGRSGEGTPGAWCGADPV